MPESAIQTDFFASMADRQAFGALFEHLPGVFFFVRAGGALRCRGRSCQRAIRAGGGRLSGQPAALLAWLERDLNASQARWKFVCMHAPMTLRAVDQSGAEIDRMIVTKA